jgi:peroxiredoxin
MHDQELVAPTDDGAAIHLTGTAIPDVRLPSSRGPVRLAVLARSRLVLYVYPRTGRPDRPAPAGWDEIPGALGCTAQSCGFRDHAAEIAEFRGGVAGLSSQPLDEQIEFATRSKMPFPIISDERRLLARRLGLPTFELTGARYYRRLALIAEEGKIVKVFYPVLAPERSAVDIVEWLRHHASG